MKPNRPAGHAALVFVAGLGLSVAGCSADLAMFRADSSWWSSSSSNAASEPLTRTAPPEGLVGPGGSCAAPSGEASHAAVGLGMTECEVLSALGPTESINIGSNEHGQRSVTMTYQGGSQPGIYRFTSGLLTSVEQLPEPPKPQRPQRRRQRR